MKEQVISIIGDKLVDLGIFIDDVIYEKEGSNNYLRIVLDSDLMLDLERVVKATKVISPLLDSKKVIDDEYILDVYAKSKGGN